MQQPLVRGAPSRFLSPLRFPYRVAEISRAGQETHNNQHPREHLDNTHEEKEGRVMV